ncbi:hypothetical protein [Chitinibacter sp. S2-10]|uniref:hypothetical protein n=1 Tax=Chitinibacter sp. S2-10 TaxID=3373597 RepID=UPI00397764B9
MPPIEGPVFQAQLPFRWQSAHQPIASNDAEVLRYLIVLADFEQNHLSLELAQAKQDLLLIWMAKQRDIALPQTTALTVGMNKLAWLNQSPLNVGETGVVEFSFSIDFPLLLSFKARIIESKLTGQYYQCVAEILSLSPAVQDQFEQTVFRHHRRAVQQARQSR